MDKMLLQVLFMRSATPDYGLLNEDNMTRHTIFGHPSLLGFDAIEQAFDRLTKMPDGYPPYNIERIPKGENSEPERMQITLAVAGFPREDLDVTLEENQLVIRGRQQEEKTRHYVHRGIAARQFQRAFLLADGMEVTGADLANGLLTIDLVRPEPERIIRKIAIADGEDSSAPLQEDDVHAGSLNA
jgi:HSP20 family molecular chaperone IbpA